MPPIEQPHVCDMCRSEVLINIGKAGRWNRVLHTGGPQQEPRIMGLGWAFYWCPMCDFRGPWKINYTGGSRELTIQYNQLLTECKERHEKRKSQGDLVEKLHGELDAASVLENLPGKGQGIEAAIEGAVAPLLERIRELEASLTKRKGGRPPLPPEEKERRRKERLAKKAAKARAQRAAQGD